MIRNIEHSIKAYRRQDGQGRVGIKAEQTTPPSSAPYIRNHQIFDYNQSKDKQVLFKNVNVFYDKNLQTQDWSVKSQTSNKIGWNYRIEEDLDIYTYLTSASDAATLVGDIQNLLNKGSIYFEIPVVLFGLLAGDLIYFSRDRAYNLQGTAKDHVLRIINIQKLAADKRTVITAERV